MTTIQDKPRLAANVRSSLAGLRWRIRAYVWLEGLAVAAIWVCLTFWIGLALDYLPVLVGATEMPRVARAVLLTVIAVVLAVILYRWILRRAFARLADRSMAVLLERRFPGFHDSLVTAVEMVERPDHASQFSGEMLQHTRDEATAGMRQVRLSSVFRFRPLLLSLVGALLLSGTIVGFSAARPSSFRIGFDRLYLLKDTTWPRRARIEMVGIVMDRSALPAESRAVLPIIPFREGVVKVAKGSSVELLVRADASKNVSVVPDYCYVYYRTDEGDRGRVRMTQVGRRQRQFQRYSLRDKPFDRIADSVSFDVVGYDHRLPGYRLQLVDNPAVIKTTVDCQYPRYTGLEPDSNLPLAPGMQLPRGCRLTIHCESNKPLRRVFVLDNSTHEVTTLHLRPIDGKQPTSFDYQVANLDSDLALEFTLQDTDDVVGQEIHRIYIGSIPDKAPQVNFRLAGIGTVVTPDVIMPYHGSIVDDFAVQRTWFQIDHKVGQGNPTTVELPFPMGSSASAESTIGSDQFEASIDFRDQRKLADGIKLAPQDQIVISVRAMDNCELAQGPNEGSGDRLQFDVVTPDELLTLLEAREISLRRRFEQMIEELTATRDSLLHVRADFAASHGASLEPGDVLQDPTEPGDEPLDPAQREQRAKSLRLIRVQEASAQTDKVSQEVLGVAESFANIGLELSNNRIDTKDRKERLEVKIAQPLRLVVQTQFPDLSEKLRHLESVLEDDQQNSDSAQACVDQADLILAELNRVLQDMLDIETYNELIDIVRSLIEDQQKLHAEAKSERDKRLFDE